MADLMTLVSSALKNDLDVWAYVKDVLDRLLAGSTDYLCPGNRHFFAYADPILRQIVAKLREAGVERL